MFNILEHGWFGTGLTPHFQTPLQAHSAGTLLNQDESRSMTKAPRKTFLREVMIFYGVPDKREDDSSGNNVDNSLGKKLMKFLFPRIFDRKFPFL